MKRRPTGSNRSWWRRFAQAVRKSSASAAVEASAEPLAVEGPDHVPGRMGTGRARLCGYVHEGTDGKDPLFANGVFWILPACDRHAWCRTRCGNRRRTFPSVNETDKRDALPGTKSAHGATRPTGLLPAGVRGPLPSRSNFFTRSGKSLVR